MEVVEKEEQVEVYDNVLVALERMAGLNDLKKIFKKGILERFLALLPESISYAPASKKALKIIDFFWEVCTADICNDHFKIILERMVTYFFNPVPESREGKFSFF